MIVVEIKMLALQRLLTLESHSRPLKGSLTLG